MKTGILEHDQAPGEVPRHRLNSVAKVEMLIGARWAVRLTRDKIKLIVTHSWATIKAALNPHLSKVVRLPSCYIPEILPSPEVPGVIFKEPISASWRKDPASQALAVRYLPIEEVTAAWLLHGMGI
jgi:hypothetical protein